nr:hypothetical protein [Phragmitibacter flavus]
MVEFPNEGAHFPGIGLWKALEKFFCFVNFAFGQQDVTELDLCSGCKLVVGMGFQKGVESLTGSVFFTQGRLLAGEGKLGLGSEVVFRMRREKFLQRFDGRLLFALVPQDLGLEQERIARSSGVRIFLNQLVVIFNSPGRSELFTGSRFLLMFGVTKEAQSSEQQHDKQQEQEDFLEVVLQKKFGLADGRDINRLMRGKGGRGVGHGN